MFTLFFWTILLADATEAEKSLGSTRFSSQEIAPEKEEKRLFVYFLRIVS